MKTLKTIIKENGYAKVAICDYGNVLYYIEPNSKQLNRRFNNKEYTIEDGEICILEDIWNKGAKINITSHTCPALATYIVEYDKGKTEYFSNMVNALTRRDELHSAGHKDVKVCIKTTLSKFLKEGI